MFFAPEGYADEPCAREPPLNGNDALTTQRSCPINYNGIHAVDGFKTTDCVLDRDGRRAFYREYGGVRDLRRKHQRNGTLIEVDSSVRDVDHHPSDFTV